MNTITKLIWAILAGIVMLWVGGATPAEATKPPTVHQTTQPLPPITGPASVPSTAPIPDECWIDNNQANALPAGSFTFYNDTSNPGATGTHSISGIPCGPLVDASTTTSPHQTELPDTGSENWAIAVVALMSTMLGGAVLWAARR
jgi:LPXTG-motif cell wall-anchored protein